MLFYQLCNLGFNNTAALVLSFALCIAVGYLLGSLNFSIIISNKVYKEDVRKKGSGNAGSTNMLRNYGTKAAVAAFCGDIAKTCAAVLLGLLIFTEKGMFIAGIGCMLGHIFPAFYGLKGGKGVACFAVIVIITSIVTGVWYIPVALLIIFLILVIGTRFVSLGSVIVAMLYPVMLNRIDSFLISKHPELETLKSLEIYAVILGLLVVIKHKENIKRLLNGEENKISLKKNKNG